MLEQKDKVADLFLLTALLAVGQAILGPLWFGGSIWAASLNAYATIGILWVVLLNLSNALNQQGARHVLDAAVENMLREKARVGPRRLRVMKIAITLVQIVCWPAWIYIDVTLERALQRRRVPSRLATAAAAMLSPTYLVLSLYLALAAFCVTGAVLVTGEHVVYAHGFMWLLIVGVAAKHIWHLSSPLNMQAQIRLGLGPVKLSYIIITLSDLFCLLFAYNVVLSGAGDAVLRPEQLPESLPAIYKKLRAFADVFNVFTEPPNDLSSWILGLSGLLWLFSLANALLKWPEYHRTATDHIEIAAATAMLGMEERAREAMARVSGPDRNQRMRLSAIFMTLGDIASGAEQARRVLRQFDDLKTTPNHRALLLQGAIGASPDPRVTIQLWVGHCLAEGCSEVVVAAAVLQTLNMGVDTKELSTWFVAQGYQTSAPMAFICLKWISDEEREVFNDYEAIAAPIDGAPLVLWRCLDAMLVPARRLPPDETRSKLLQWHEQSFPDLQRGIDTTSDAVEAFALLVVLERLQAFLLRFGDIPSDFSGLQSACKARIMSDEAVVEWLKLVGGDALVEKIASPAVSEQPVPALAKVSSTHASAGPDPPSSVGRVLGAR